MIALGIMSGTSMDGLDLILSEINIDKNYKLSFNIIRSQTYPYTAKDKKIIYDAVYKNNISYDFLDNYLGKVLNDSVFEFLERDKVDIICSHGQTISHNNKKYSIQLGNPKALHRNFNIPIVYNFRSNDIAFGGNGAPLVPFLDWLLFKNYNIKTIGLNIGGISNLSIINPLSKLKDVIGFDIGPGMCIIDKYVEKYWNIEYDIDGKLASKGIIDKELLDYLIETDSFINKSFPKSLSTEHYGEKFLNSTIDKFNKINKYNFLRTLVNFTAISISKNLVMAFKKKQSEVYQIVVSGGGSKNKMIIDDINRELGIKVKFLNINGLNIDNKEAFLIAVLGISTYFGLPNNSITVTGCSKELTCGLIYE